MVSATSLREPIEDSLGTTLGFLVDLLDFLVGMAVVGNVGT